MSGGSDRKKDKKMFTANESKVVSCVNNKRGRGDGTKMAANKYVFESQFCRSGNIFRTQEFVQAVGKVDGSVSYTLAVIFLCKMAKDKRIVRLASGMYISCG